VIAPEEAWRRIAERLEPRGATRASRADARGRVLASAVRARVDVPPFDTSAMDGFAIGGDLAPGTVLVISATLPAGAAPGLALEAGTAVRIMTGAPVPAGTARVVPVEETAPPPEPESGGQNTRVAFPRGASGPDHIRRQGEITQRGSTLLERGRLLTPGALALLASHGVDTVEVHGAPRLASITTGDEVVPADREPAAGQIRDSHTDFLNAATAQLGLVNEPLGIVRDEPQRLRALVAEGLSRDVLLLSGGVSMGEFDLVEGVLAEHGCEPLFDSVAIQPGKPMVAAVHPGGWVFALPGNPASAMVCFWLFVRPALRRMLGFEDGFWHGALHATARAPLPAAKSRDLFLPGIVDFDAAGPLGVRVATTQGSHDVAAYANGTVLVRVPRETPEQPAGSRCEVLPLVEWVEGGARRGAGGDPG
jgi:molybdopterin molybdotransferase